MSLWRDRTFMTVWSGQAASEIGTAVTGLVLPLLAVTGLHARPGQIGLLQACATAAYLVASIPAGILVDRCRKRVVMIGCDVGRGLLLGTIPLAGALWQVHLGQLYLVAFLTGVLSVAFGIAYHAYYPIFVPADSLPEANAKIGATEAFARISGPGIGAALVGLIGATTALLADVASYAVSTVSLLLTRPAGDVARHTGTRLDVRAETIEGFARIRADRVLARTAVCTIASVFCLGATSAVFVYYLVHDLRLGTGEVGATFALGEVGGLGAAIAARRLMRRVGTARILWIVPLSAPAGYLAALATPPTALVLASLFMILSSARFVLFDIAQYSYRQLACPLDKLGKVNATIRLGVGSASALGELLGGWFGDLFGARTTITAATTLLCLAGLPVLFSPLRRARDVTELIESSSAGTEPATT